MSAGDATARQQNLAGGGRSRGTAPDDSAAGIHVGGERDCTALNILVSLVAKGDINAAVFNINRTDVAPLCI